jgi:hypothetical protein
MSMCRHVAICLSLPAGIQPQLYSGPQAWRTDYTPCVCTAASAGLQPLSLLTASAKGIWTSKLKLLAA